MRCNRTKKFVILIKRAPLEPFFGDRHMSGREGVQFFTQQKVTMARMAMPLLTGLGAPRELAFYRPGDPNDAFGLCHHYNPCEAMAIRGRPHVVTVRGQVALRAGKFIGQANRGRFL